MSAPEGRKHEWLRPAGLFALGLGLAVGQPLVVGAACFGIFALLAPGGGLPGLVAGGLVLGFVFAGTPSGGLWYLERGWAVLVGGWFAALTQVWPARPFFPRALAALAGASVWAAGVFLAVAGWDRVDWLIGERVRASAATTLELFGAFGGEAPQGMADTVARTAAVQEFLFPALLALSTLAMLGVAWWLHVRVSTGSGGGLGALRNFRFADPLIWFLIGGILLGLVAGWSTEWGRLGTNLAVFMGALYALRGAGVLLWLAGGVSIGGALLVGVGIVLAAPLLLAGAMVVGVGDSWLDLRARARAVRGGGSGPE